MMITPQRKARIQWNCRRGMLELDLMLKQFSDNELDHLNNTQVDAFEDLLKMQDPDIYHWLMSDEEVEEKELANIVSKIRNYNKR